MISVDPFFISKPFRFLSEIPTADYRFANNKLGIDPARISSHLLDDCGTLFVSQVRDKF